MGAFAEQSLVVVSAFLAYPFLYVGQVALLRSRIKDTLRIAWLDGVLVALVLIAAAAVFIIPGLRSTLDLTTATVVAVVPALDFLLLGFAVAYYFIVGWRRGRHFLVVAAAFALLLLGDLMYVLHLIGVLGADATLGLAGVWWLCALWVVTTVAGNAVPPPDDRQIGGITPLVVPAIVMVASGFLIMVDHFREQGVFSLVLCLMALAGVGAKLIRTHVEVSRLADSRRLAMTDDLTGLANRRALLADLSACVGTSETVSLLLIDLDRFKDVNDRFGHLTGDRLLCDVADRLVRLTPSGGFLARMGGDEFALVLREASAEDARAAARSAVTGLDCVVSVDGHQIVTAASVGVVTAMRGSLPGVGGTEMMRRADVAMYLAKSAGGGHAVYDDKLDAAARERALLVDELRVALEPADLASPIHLDGPVDQIVVYYQPQVDAETRAVVGVEALVRWQHPRLGLLSPDAFLDLAEEYDLMGAITARVLWSAAEQAARWRASGMLLRLSVNLSASSLCDAGLLDLLDAVTVSTGLAPDALVLEITETTLMADPAAALQITRAITSRGTGLSIDDYGTGYSSMAYLHALPATELKLDRSFTARLLDDERSAAISATAVDLAHRLGMRVVAEGVEDRVTLDALRELGCDTTQGYFHGRPMPADTLTAWICARESARVLIDAVDPVIARSTPG